MLDAYVDQQVQNPATHDDGKPVSKKNKNKKKREQREAEEKRRQSESNSQHPDDDEDEVTSLDHHFIVKPVADPTECVTARI